MLSCGEHPASLFEARLPPGFPLPDGESHIESVSLGTTTTHIYAYTEKATALTVRLRDNLARSGWPFTTDDAATIALGPGFRVIARARDEGATSHLSLEIVRGQPPAAPVAPRLEGPPASYPRGFAFLPGGRLHSESKSPPSVEIDYRGSSRAQIANRLRATAERARWMCTQGEARFVCAVGPRSVDVTLWRKGETVRVVVRGE